MKKIVAVTIASVLFFAYIAHAQMNTSLYIEEIAYKSNGNIKLEFEDNTVRKIALRWTERETIDAFDKSGRKIPAEINSRGADWLTIYAPGIAEGETYTFELRRVSYGVRNDDIVYTGFFVASEGWKIEYREPLRFRKQFMQPGVASTENIFIREMEYNHGGDLDIKFAGFKRKKISLEWSGGESVAVRDETGLTYDARIIEYGHNEIEVKIHDVVENMNYIIEISNIPYGGRLNSFKASFTARDDWRYRPPRPENRP